MSKSSCENNILSNHTNHLASECVASRDTGSEYNNVRDSKWATRKYDTEKHPIRRSPYWN